jgi:hypothetical protein
MAEPGRRPLVDDELADQPLGKAQSEARCARGDGVSFGLLVAQPRRGPGNELSARSCMRRQPRWLLRRLRIPEIQTRRCTLQACEWRHRAVVSPGHERVGSVTSLITSCGTEAG